ncbi:LPS export ABC transporter periplasmic protein LptC [Corallincola luteus]|nr:LPS export ABC transporter periplasmic protein LptC [Corallincola luteus]TCI03554.1 LPS export ABC transporter periplasmic protein LptC [Corallincola luteus]
MNRVILFTVILFGAAIGLYYYQSLLKSEIDINAENQGQQRPDYTAKTLRSRIYNQEGQLENQIWASNMKYYNGSMTLTQFDAPKLVVYPSGKRSGWTLNASHGELEQNNLLRLSEDVVITMLTAQNQTNTLLTDYVDIDLTTNDVSSDQPVTVKGPGYRLDGVGLKGNVEQEHIEVLNDVKATYEPEK